MTAAYLTLDLE